MGSPVFSVIRIAANRLPEFFRGAGRASPEDFAHAASVLLWVRWFGLGAAFVEIHYRVDYWSFSHVLNTFYCLGFLAANGYVHWVMRRRGAVKPAWLFVLSALDLGAISFSASLSGGFNSPYFPAYYFAVAVFAYVFTSPRFVLPWTTLVAAIYSVLNFTVEPTLDIAGKEEQHLFYRGDFSSISGKAFPGGNRSGLVCDGKSQRFRILQAHRDALPWIGTLSWVYGQGGCYSGVPVRDGGAVAAVGQPVPAAVHSVAGQPVAGVGRGPGERDRAGCGVVNGGQAGWRRRDAGRPVWPMMAGSGWLIRGIGGLNRLERRTNGHAPVVIGDNCSISFVDVERVGG